MVQGKEPDSLESATELLDDYDLVQGIGAL